MSYYNVRFNWNDTQKGSKGCGYWKTMKLATADDLLKQLNYYGSLSGRTYTYEKLPHDSYWDEADDLTDTLRDAGLDELSS